MKANGVIEKENATFIDQDLPADAEPLLSGTADAGIVITASHNPYGDNGIKLFGPDGFKLSDEIEHKIEELIDSELVKMLAKSADLGRARRIDDGQGRYVEFAKRTLPRNLSFDGLRVVVDCANGAAYRVAPQALWELGAEVISLGVRLDRARGPLPESEGDARRYRHRARR